MQKYANDDGLREEMGNIFEESDVVLEEIIKISGIRDAKPQELVTNWTSTQLLVRHSSR